MRGRVLRVSYGREELELRPVGKCDVTTDWTVASMSLLCRDQVGGWFMVRIRQRLFSMAPLKMSATRLSARIGAVYRGNCSPLGKLALFEAEEMKEAA